MSTEGPSLTGLTAGLSGLLRSLPGPGPLRRKIFRLKPVFFLELLMRGSLAVTAGGLPRDTRLVSVHYAATSDEFTFVVEHPSFEPVAEGHELPLVQAIQFQFLDSERPLPDPEPVSPAPGLPSWLSAWAHDGGPRE